MEKTKNKIEFKEGKILAEYLKMSCGFEGPEKQYTNEERYQKIYNHVRGEIMDTVKSQLFPLQIICDYVGTLVEKAGKEGHELTLSFKELFNLSAALDVSFENVERALSVELPEVNP